jgi:hypothetical protein
MVGHATIPLYCLLYRTVHANYDCTNSGGASGVGAEDNRSCLWMYVQLPWKYINTIGLYVTCDEGSAYVKNYK